MFLCQCWICARSLCCVPLLSVKSRPSVLFVAACQVITDDYRLQIIEVTMTERMQRPFFRALNVGPTQQDTSLFLQLSINVVCRPKRTRKYDLRLKRRIFSNIFDKYDLSGLQIQRLTDAANLRVHCKSINGFSSTFLPLRG